MPVRRRWHRRLAACSVPLLTLLAVHGCQSASTPAVPTDAGNGSDCSATLEACNDGTGLSDCCPEDLVDGTECACGPVTCWTRCTMEGPADSGKVRSEMVCSGGTWLAGRGLFPCEVVDP